MKPPIYANLRQIYSNFFQLARLCFILLIVWVPQVEVQGQSVDSPRPIDLLIVIDNSCSMFPQDQILAGCTSFGSDPDFLRIKGANIFIARLGFGEENEDQYQQRLLTLVCST